MTSTANNSYVNEIDELVVKLLTDYGVILSASRVGGTRVENDKLNLDVQVASSNIAQTAESLLRISTELRQMQLVNGVGNVAVWVEEDVKRANHFDDLKQSVSQRLTTLSSEIESALQVLENNYYHSVYRPH